MYSLMVSISNTPSAVAINRDAPGLPLGYEEYKLTGDRHTKAFPQMALSQIASMIHPRVAVDECIITHPYNQFDPDMPTACWQPESVKKLFPSVKEFKVINEPLHNLMAHAGLAYMEGLAHPSFTTRDPWHILVINDEGTRGEVASLYRVSPYLPRTLYPVCKTYGGQLSLGYLFKYAAEMNSMHPHDAYTGFLPYRETTIKSQTIIHAGEYSEQWQRQASNQVTSPYMIDSPAQNHRDYFYKVLEPYKDDMAAMGQFIQTVAEQCILFILGVYGVHNVVCVGSIFGNSRINCSLRTSVRHLAIMPLLQDNCAIFGAFRHAHPITTTPYPDYCIGTRPRMITTGRNITPPRFVTATSVQDLIPSIIDLINSGAIVNIVRPRMEFGTFPMGHTSTLALPNETNYKLIKQLQNDSTDTPFPLLTTKQSARYTFTSQDFMKVVGQQYPTIAFRFNVLAQSKHYAVAMKDGGVYFGIPQIVNKDNDSFLYEIVRKANDPGLLNTFFGYSGIPVFTKGDAINIHNQWHARSRSNGNRNVPSIFTFYVE